HVSLRGANLYLDPAQRSIVDGIVAGADPRLPRQRRVLEPEAEDPVRLWPHAQCLRPNRPSRSALGPRRHIRELSKTFRRSPCASKTTCATSPRAPPNSILMGRSKSSLFVRSATIAQSNDLSCPPSGYTPQPSETRTGRFT